MPINQKKVISIIIKQCNKIEERCDGYREELINNVSDIIDYERQHAIQGINIKQKIADKCDATGNYLTRHRKKLNKQST